MTRRWIRVAALAGALLMLASGLSVSAARPVSYDADGCMPLITEPGDSAEPLIFCRGDQDLSMDQVTWVDGGRGKAVRFNGVDEYFRIGKNAMELKQFTLSMWVKWEGASTSESQRIFSARGNYRERQYITLSPLETTAEGTDGLRLHLRYENADWDMYRPQAGPLAQNVWNHLVFVADGESIALYLNGVELDKRLIGMSLEEMEMYQLYLGKGTSYNGDGYFNGLMDNVYLYKKALDVDAVGELFAQQRPDELNTTVPTTTTTVPVNVSETIPPVEQQANYSLPAVPPIVWIVVGIVVALIAALFVTENLRYAREHKTEQ